MTGEINPVWLQLFLHGLTEHDDVDDEDDEDYYVGGDEDLDDGETVICQCCTALFHATNGTTCPHCGCNGAHSDDEDEYEYGFGASEDDEDEDEMSESDDGRGTRENPIEID